MFASSTNRREEMFARVSSYQESPNGIDESIRNWEKVMSGVEQQLDAMGIRGQGALLLVDRNTGKTMTITLWESEEDMAASAETANNARSEATQTTGGQIVSVEQFEVALDMRK